MIQLYGVLIPCFNPSEIIRKGGYFLEAPVSGTKVPAEKVELVMLVSGEESKFQAMAPVWNVLSKRQFFLGAYGAVRVLVIGRVAFFC